MGENKATLTLQISSASGGWPVEIFNRGEHIDLKLIYEKKI